MREPDSYMSFLYPSNSWPILHQKLHHDGPCPPSWYRSNKILSKLFGNHDLLGHIQACSCPQYRCLGSIFHSPRVPPKIDDVPLHDIFRCASITRRAIRLSLSDWLIDGLTNGFSIRVIYVSDIFQMSGGICQVAQTLIKCLRHLLDLSYSASSSWFSGFNKYNRKSSSKVESLLTPRTNRR